MKKLTIIILVALSLMGLSSCRSHQHLSVDATQEPWQKSIIPGHYAYTHSWTYPSPVGDYTITCHEEGTIDFRRNGTYVDHAVQYHTANTPEATCWTYDYECHGQWDVANAKFRFNELSRGFVMELMGVSVDYAQDLEAVDRLGRLLVQRAIPNSDRWFDFDIRMLTDTEFTWSYTYPDGHIDYWEMHRKHFYE